MTEPETSRTVERTRLSKLAMAKADDDFAFASAVFCEGREDQLQAAKEALARALRPDGPVDRMIARARAKRG